MSLAAFSHQKMLKENNFKKTLIDGKQKKIFDVFTLKSIITLSLPYTTGCIYYTISC